MVGELDEVNRTMSLYINGQLIETVNLAEGTLDEIGYFMVGQPATRYYEYENAANPDENRADKQGWAMRDGFVGTIDEIHIYNTLLSEEQIASLYTLGTKEYEVPVPTVQNPTEDPSSQLPQAGNATASVNAVEVTRAKHTQFAFAAIAVAVAVPAIAITMGIAVYQKRHKKR